MYSVRSLDALGEGQSAKVVDIKSGASMRRRLQDIGLIEGSQVECLQKSPFGDPVAYLICGATIALRREDSGNVLVQLS